MNAFQHHRLNIGQKKCQFYSEYVYNYILFQNYCIYAISKLQSNAVYFVLGKKGSQNDIFFPFQVVIDISDKGSVICWDFDVMKDDVTFSVYRTTQPVPQPETEINDDELQGCGHPSLPLSMLNLDAPIQSVVPKQWVLGKDYHTVENTITCKDGESVQVK